MTCEVVLLDGFKQLVTDGLHTANRGMPILFVNVV
jgi:hypothetical protein